MRGGIFVFKSVFAIALWAMAISPFALALSEETGGLIDPTPRDPRTYHLTDDTPLVLMYHNVIDPLDPGASKLLNDPQGEGHSSVTVQNFRDQMHWLKDNGYTAVSMDDLYAAKLGLLKLPVKSVVLSFDDGYVGDNIYAVPILRELGMKASFFVHTSFVGDTVTETPHMSWDDLKKIDQDPLFHVYPHTETHPHLASETDTQLDNELCGARKVMEDHLGTENSRRFMAYPFGEYTKKGQPFSERVLQATAKCYDMALGIDFPPNLPAQFRFSPYTQPRMTMSLEIKNTHIFEVAINQYHAKYQDDAKLVPSVMNSLDSVFNPPASCDLQ